MRVSKSISDSWVYPCFGRSKNGDIVWFTGDGVGSCVIGDSHLGDNWIMECFELIDNPFEYHACKFKPIRIVLDTREEFDHLCMAIDVGDIILVDLLARLRACDSSYS
jgi:hypothetical protein